MKKMLSVLLIMGFLLGVGSMAFAEENGNGYGRFNFGQMLPFMQQMHPDWSVEELQDMYNACHGTNGAAPSRNFQGMNFNNMMGF